MLFFVLHTIAEKELKDLKRILRVASALLASALLAWYVSPQVYRVLHLPDCVDADTELTAPALSARYQNARLVRESEDERLFETSKIDVTVSMFGVIPLRTVSTISRARTVCAGGKAVGIVLRTQGVQIVGFERIAAAYGDVCPAVSAGLREGDMISAVNGEKVTDSEQFAKLCENVQGECLLSCLRDGEPLSVTVTPVKDADGTPRIGAWVRDGTSGIGTLSFFDPDTGAFAALGHGVTDVDTQKLIAPAIGFLTKATIRRVQKGNGSAAGELIGQFSLDEADAIAKVERNTAFGIGGTLYGADDGSPRTEIAPGAAAHKGDATILSTVDGETRAYTVRVIRVDVQSSPETQGMMIEITDPLLLEKTGGIVQGMSGSPLLQDGRLIGVVTHVFLNQPSRGYCLYAEWMAEELLGLS